MNFGIWRTSFFIFRVPKYFTGQSVQRKQNIFVFSDRIIVYNELLIRSSVHFRFDWFYV